MKNSVSIKKPTFILTIALTLGVGVILGIALSAYISTKGVETKKAKNLKGMETAILSKLKENPKNVALLVQLGHFYFDNGMPEKAIVAYEKSLSIKPAQPNVMTDLAIMYRRANKKKKAIEVLDKVIKNYPNHQPSRFNKGIILINDFKDNKGAVKIWESLLKLNPNFRAPDGQPLKDLLKHYKDGH